MGQSASSPAPEHQQLTRELLAHELAGRFANELFTPVEIYSYKDVFRRLADSTTSTGVAQQPDHPVTFVREDTLARFLELPDILGASPVVFRLASHLGAFPFLLDAPVPLGLDQLLVVIALVTQRYKRILARGALDRTRLFFVGLAVHDRRMSEAEHARAREDAEARKQGGAGVHDGGFAVDAAADEAGDGEDDDDYLPLTELANLHIDDAFRHGDAPSTAEAMIPGDNFRHLVMLLLLTAPLTPQVNLARLSALLTPEELQSLRATADNVVASFINVEKAPGVKWRAFKEVATTVCPNIFDGLDPLFERFLFSPNLDLSKRQPNKDNEEEDKGKGNGEKEPAAALIKELESPPPPVLISTGEIMNHSVLSQLSFFLPGSSLFGRLRPLYSGNVDGFSIMSFESKVFNWRAPTILLVRGTRIPDMPDGGQEAAFVSSIPSRRFRHGSKGEQLTFGLYLHEPWRHTHTKCFGDADTVLFQLEPVTDVFRTSSVINTDHVSFTKPPTHPPYLAVGAPHPHPTKTLRRGGDTPHLPLGPVSLLLDGSFEFGAFNHEYNRALGGAFAPSVVRRFDFQDRFAVEALEVWGCGGDKEAKAQAERWAFEQREAEARRRINLGTGDRDSDRALLEMAGLVGANRSGGSMT